MANTAKNTTLFGRVQAIIFAKDSYYVFALSVLQPSDSAEKVVKVRGHLHGIEQLKAGVTLSLTGKWVTHAQYGRQLVIQSWEPWAETVRDVESFLTICISGFLDAAQLLAQKYGVGCFEVLTETPDIILKEFPGFEEALLGWGRFQTTRELVVLLRGDGLSATVIHAALAVFGNAAGKVLSANPYRLMELPGMAFDAVDKIAFGMGIPLDDPRRFGGAVLHALRAQTQKGHLYVERDALLGAVSGVLHQEVQDLDQVYANLSAVGAIVVVSGVGIYLSDLFTYEHATAQMLADNLAPVQLEVSVDAFLAEYEKNNGIVLSDKQREAVRLLPRNRVLVLTGGPGTGKTTCLRALVQLFDAARLSTKLMAPTGIAAKHLASVSGHAATTIHRALRYDGNTWGQNSSNRIVVDAVIVDECSMLTQELLYRLLDALTRNTILVFVGDDAQLPSVGPGSVLRELITCPVLSRVRLTQIFRQAESSAIVLNAHRVNRGEMVVFHEDSDFSLVPISDEGELAKLLVEFAAKLKSRDANFQVISPKYAGVVGVDNLNTLLRDRLNPARGQCEVQYGDFNIRVGDRVMVVQNDYKRGVYNGDMGKVIGVDRGNLAVRIFGAGLDGCDSMVSFPRDDDTKLRLAYAVTVHRTQGLEFDTVLLPLVHSQGGMLQRNLFYTALTRAKKKCWVMGDTKAVWQAIRNDKEMKRNTRLSDLIMEILGVA